MKNTSTLIDQFLKDSGIQRGPIVAGGPPDLPKLSRSQIDRFTTMLEKSRDQNRMLAYGVFVLHVLVLLVAIVFTWIRHDDPSTLTGVLSVGSGILFATILSFRAFFREKTSMDLLLAILPGATPDEALKILLATMDQRGK